MLTFTPFFVIVFLTKIIPPRGVVIKSGSAWILERGLVYAGRQREDQSSFEDSTGTD